MPTLAIKITDIEAWVLAGVCLKGGGGANPWERESAGVGRAGASDGVACGRQVPLLHLPANGYVWKWESTLFGEKWWRLFCYSWRQLFTEGICKVVSGYRQYCIVAARMICATDIRHTCNGSPSYRPSWQYLRENAGTTKATQGLSLCFRATIVKTNLFQLGRLAVLLHLMVPIKSTSGRYACLGLIY